MPKRTYATAAARQIVAVLTAAGDRTVTVPQLCERLSQSGCEMNKTTVYRNLEKLVKDGVVARYADKDGECAGYQYIGKNACHGHLHLQCVGCGRVYHLDGGVTELLGDHARVRHGFSLQCDGSVLYGTCAACRQNG